MAAGPRQPLTPSEAFLDLYWKDREAGSIRPLEEYLRLFPGESEAIRRELSALAADPEDGSTIALPQRPGSSSPAGPPGRIGPYVILKELGRGSQGAVYLAEDTKLPRKVALKVLLRSGFSSHEAKLRFQREAEVLSRLDHPSICPVLDAGVDDGTPYIAMRFVEGRTFARVLHDACKRRADPPTASSFVDTIPHAKPPADDAAPPPPPSRIDLMGYVQVVEEAARALDVAHEANVIHRDVKPGNIMMGKDGRTVVLDFGLASADDDAAEELSSPGQIFGTPAYMSPEQLAPQTLDVDRRTDVWSLGVTLYEAVTFRRPFVGQTPQALARAILTDEPVDPRRQNPAVPRDLAVVILNALDKNPVRRYGTAGFLADDLRRVRLRQPVNARPVGALGRLSRWFSRNPLLAASVTALFAVMAAALVTGAILLDRATTARNEAHFSAGDAQASLRRYEQLADAKRVRDLLREADENLWPRRPDKVREMDAWLASAENVLSRTNEHRSALETLKIRARAPIEADRRHEEELRRHRHPVLFEKRQKLLQQRDELSRNIAESGVEAIRADRQRQLDAVETDLREIDLSSHMTSRLCWHFDSPEDGWRFQVLDDLLPDLERLRRRVDDVQLRRDYALNLQKRSIDDNREAWNHCIRSIRESGRYENLRLVPQLELVPLREDPESHLWEFWHVGSGTRPAVDEALDRLVLALDTGIILVLLPGGAFHCGAQAVDPQEPNYDPAAVDEVEGVRTVRLDPFFISKYEMTQGQWMRFAGSNPSSELSVWPNAADSGVALRHPVEGIHQPEAADEMRRLGLQLPTGAQWEYAARAETGSPWWTGDRPESLAGAANIADSRMDQGDYSEARFLFRMTLSRETWLDDGFSSHAPVGSFRPNAFGLHDVLGNVAEWITDSAFAIAFGAESRVGDGARVLFSDDGVYIARGGSWIHDAAASRCTSRYTIDSTSRWSFLGLRPARMLEQQ